MCIIIKRCTFVGNKIFCNINQIIVITGPTASEKTAKAIEMALQMNCDIISADSRQVYREMSIGTAKPTVEQLSKVNHHFIGHVSIHQEYNVGKYEHEAISLLEDYFKDNDKIILCGGTGLYIDAVLFGIDVFPEIPNTIKSSINTKFEEQGLSWLQQEVLSLDKEYFNKVDQDNPRRLIRALEVIYTTGDTYTSFRTGSIIHRNFEVKGIVAMPERPLLYDRINKRVDRMILMGLEEEAKSFYPYKDLKALQTVGYQEFFDYFDNKISRERAIELIKQNTRNYAKRQITWMKKYTDFEKLSS